MLKQNYSHGMSDADMTTQHDCRHRCFQRAICGAQGPCDCLVLFVIRFPWFACMFLSLRSAMMQARAHPELIDCFRACVLIRCTHMAVC